FAMWMLALGGKLEKITSGIALAKRRRRVRSKSFFKQVPERVASQLKRKAKRALAFVLRKFRPDRLATSRSRRVNVRFWHKADITTTLSNVRFRGKAGHMSFPLSCCAPYPFPCAHL